MSTVQRVFKPKGRVHVARAGLVVCGGGFNGRKAAWLEVDKTPDCRRCIGILNSQNKTATDNRQPTLL